MRRKHPAVDWRSTAEGRAKYTERRAEAQRKANETGFDYGLEANEIFKDYMVAMLPQKANRYGHELRCEVVSCEIWEKIQPGHGPSVLYSHERKWERT